MPSQWETSLQSNAISHWLGTSLESALTQISIKLQLYKPCFVTHLMCNSCKSKWTNLFYNYATIVISYECCGISYHWWFYFIHAPFILLYSCSQKKNTKDFHYWPLLMGIPLLPVDSSQKWRNRNIISLSLCCLVYWVTSDDLAYAALTCFSIPPYRNDNKFILPCSKSIASYELSVAKITRALGVIQNKDVIFASIGNPIVEIRQYYNHLFSIIGFHLIVR